MAFDFIGDGKMLKKIREYAIMYKKKTIGELL